MAPRGDAPPLLLYALVALSLSRGSIAIRGGTYDASKIAGWMSKGQRAKLPEEAAAYGQLDVVPSLGSSLWVPLLSASAPSPCTRCSGSAHVTVRGERPLLPQIPCFLRSPRARDWISGDHAHHCLAAGENEMHHVNERIKFSTHVSRVDEAGMVVLVAGRPWL